MNKRFTRVEKEMRETYFPALKLTGITGVIIPCDKFFSSNIINAKKYDMEVWIDFDVTEKISTIYIDYDSSGVVYNEGVFESFSYDGLKNTVKALKKDELECIDGFIIKYPSTDDIIWSESFKADFYNEFSNYIEDYLFNLFEPTEKMPSFRSWYFEKCESFIYNTYVKPVISWAKRRKLHLCFDIGEERSRYHHIKRNISVIDLLEREVRLLVKHKADNISEISVLLSAYNNSSFVLSDGYDEKIIDLKSNMICPASLKNNVHDNESEKILFIRCDRGVMDRYVKYDDMYGLFDECPAMTASFESTYYIDMLHEKGFNFSITNERLFEKYTKYKKGVLTYKNTKIDQILLCKSCVFTENGVKKLNELKKSGICINNSNLIKILEADLIQGEE